MTQVWERWGVVLTATAAAIPIAVAIVWALARWRTRSGRSVAAFAWRRSAAEVGAVVGTLPWLWMVLTPRPAPSTVNLVPLSDLADLTTAPLGEVAVQLVGNLLVFAAAGFCLPIRFRLSLTTVVLGAAFAAVGIEVAQHLLDLGRVSSVDDVLVNTLGAGIAALAARPWWARRCGDGPPARPGSARAGRTAVERPRSAQDAPG